MSDNERTTSKGSLGRTIWRGAAAVTVVGMAFLCWNQIARTLGDAILVPFEYGGGVPGLPSPLGGTASVHNTDIEYVSLALTHISAGLQWMIAGDIVLKFLLLAAVVLTVGIVWVRTSSGRPFAPSVTRALATLAVMVAVAGSGIEILESFIGERESFEAFGGGIGGAYADATGFTFSGFSILVAIGIGVLASAFAIGARLTKDTEGLV
jgi:hypothetical protein